MNRRHRKEAQREPHFFIPRATQRTLRLILFGILKPMAEPHRSLFQHLLWLGILVLTLRDSVSLAGQADLVRPVATGTFHVVDERCPIDDRLLALVFSGRWSECRELCAHLVLRGLVFPTKIARWADRVSSGRLQLPTIFVGRDPTANSWHHPFSEELNREAFGVIGELQSLIRSGQWNGIARMMADPTMVATVGLAPALPKLRPEPILLHAPWLTRDLKRNPSPDIDRMKGVFAGLCLERGVANDGGLLVSVSTAFRQVSADHPQVVTRLDAEFGDRIALSVQQAMGAAEIATVEQIADQFHGTRAARQARRWLGDQMMARGRWSVALHQYLQMEPKERDKANDLNGRIQLAQAMLGERAEGPKDASVTIGDLQILATDFQDLIDDMINRSEPPNGRQDFSRVGGPLPMELRVQSCQPLEPRFNVDPTSGSGEDTLSPTDDSIRSPTSLAVSQRLLFVNTRTEIVAFEMLTKSILWASRLRSTKSGQPADWIHVPMRPVLLGPFVLTRRVIDSGTVLECRWSQTGRMHWTAESRESEFVSDPFEWHGRVACLTLGQKRAIEDALNLTLFDENSGDIAEQFPLVRIRNSWWDRRCCEVQVADGRLYVSLGGVTFSCDETAKLQWVRTQTVLPPSIDQDWLNQKYQPPLIRGGRIFLMQPGVRSVESIDARTGRQLWCLSIPHIREIVGVVGARLIVRSDRYLFGLDIESGRPLWKVSQWDPMSILDGGRKGLLCTRIVPTNGGHDANSTAVQFGWLDAIAGKVSAFPVCDELSGTRPVIGPMVRDGDDFWTLFAEDHDLENTKLVQLGFSAGRKGDQ